MPDVKGSAVGMKYDNINQLEHYLSSLSLEFNAVKCNLAELITNGISVV